jgi:hypothetical protein
VTRDSITMKVLDLRTNDWAAQPLVKSWQPVRAEGDKTLIISEELVGGGGRGPYESVIAFTSEDEMSMRPRESGRLIANFRRAKR